MDLEAKTSRRLALELVAASFVVLFQELTLIRWLPGQIRVLAYFPNLILLSAFLADKVIYEVLYEARNRPTWLQIPLAAAAQLAEQ